MAQAKSLTQYEIDQVLRYVSTTRYHKRNRAIVLTSFWSGMRVGEIANLKISDIRNEDGSVKSEIRLSSAQTKGKFGRTVYVNEKLRSELTNYLVGYKLIEPSAPLFKTEKNKAFSPNTLTQWFFWMYKKAAVSGASSHSGRRTFITTLAQKGVGVRVLAKLAGHRSISITQVYIDVNADMMRKAAELI